MTNDEAIKEFQSELRWAELNEYPYISKRKVEADKMAIKALKQESALDKIRDEIEHLHDWAFSREEILRIIDKCKEESEE